MVDLFTRRPSRYSAIFSASRRAKGRAGAPSSCKDPPGLLPVSFDLRRCPVGGWGLEVDDPVRQLNHGHFPALFRMRRRLSAMRSTRKVRPLGERRHPPATASPKRSAHLRLRAGVLDDIVQGRRSRRDRVDLQVLGGGVGFHRHARQVEEVRDVRNPEGVARHAAPPRNARLRCTVPGPSSCATPVKIPSTTGHGRDRRLLSHTPARTWKRNKYRPETSQRHESPYFPGAPGFELIKPGYRPCRR